MSEEESKENEDNIELQKNKKSKKIEQIKEHLKICQVNLCFLNAQHQLIQNNKTDQLFAYIIADHVEQDNELQLLIYTFQENLNLDSKANGKLYNQSQAVVDMMNKYKTKENSKHFFLMNQNDFFENFSAVLGIAASQYQITNQRIISPNFSQNDEFQDFSKFILNEKSEVYINIEQYTNQDPSSIYPVRLLLVQENNVSAINDPQLQSSRAIAENIEKQGRLVNSNQFKKAKLVNQNSLIDINLLNPQVQEKDSNTSSQVPVTVSKNVNKKDQYDKLQTSIQNIETSTKQISFNIPNPMDDQYDQQLGQQLEGKEENIIQNNINNQDILEKLAFNKYVYIFGKGQQDTINMGKSIYLDQGKYIVFVQVMNKLSSESSYGSPHISLKIFANQLIRIQEISPHPNNFQNLIYKQRIMKSFNDYYNDNLSPENFDSNIKPNDKKEDLIINQLILTEEGTYIQHYINKSATQKWRQRQKFDLDNMQIQNNGNRIDITMLPKSDQIIIIQQYYNFKYSLEAQPGICHIDKFEKKI